MKKLIVLFFLSQIFVGFAQDIYLHCGQLIDTEKGDVFTEKTIVVSGNKIKVY